MGRTLVDVGRGYGQYGRPLQILEMYRDWVNDPTPFQGGAWARENHCVYNGYEWVEEAGSTSDFPNYLSNVLNKIFFDRYERAESQWRAWSRVISVSDFKSFTSVSLSGFPRLLKRAEGGVYPDANISEVAGPTIKVETYGRSFSLNREVIINDDLQQLNDIPDMMAEAADTTLAITVVQETLENPGNSYDGTAFFHSDHGNLGTDALDEAGIQVGVAAMRKQKDSDGYPLRLRPSILVIPTDLEFTADRLLNSSEIPQPGTGIGNRNVVQTIVSNAIVEPYLTDTNNWYLFADPNSTRPAMEVAFLNGMQRPQVMLKNPEVSLIMGGLGNMDPYTMPIDEIWWKVRHEYGAKMWEHRSAYKSNVT